MVLVIYCNMRPAVNRAVRQFLETTTLHGFKYLSSPFSLDRVGWLACCAASACCAGGLCAVLWARFLQLPALLALLDSRDAAHARFPVVAICPSPTRVAQLFEQKMGRDNEPDVNIQALFNSLLRRQTMTSTQIEYLEHILSTHKMTLPEALLHVTEPCPAIVRVCRWNERRVPCELIFQKEITTWGACCLARQDELNEDAADALMRVQSLDLILQCSDAAVPNGCEFYTKYAGEETVMPVALTVGYNYKAQLTFTEIKDSSKEKLIDGNCVSDPEYSTKRCLRTCKERACGCLDPLTAVVDDVTLPVCTLRQMGCLKTTSNEECRCVPSCSKITTQTSLEGARINQLPHTYDPFFASANASSVVFSMRVRRRGSKTFDLMYNDTWWSLLSSLGGVFNMFLGVGLFSVVELVFFLSVRLPGAVRRAAELPLPAPPPPPPRYRSVVTAGWVAWCVASAWCAALLCAVLWARFQSAPLLLSQVPLAAPPRLEDTAPLLAVCLSPYRAAHLLADHLSKDLEELDWLPILFSNILRGKPAPEADRLLLDELLGAHNLTLPKALLDFIAPCKELMRKCQWQSRVVPCNVLFAKEVTRWGACCVMREERLLQISTLSDHLQSTKNLALNMDCYIKRNYDSYCCEFFIKYRDEDWVGPWYLMSGHIYNAYIELTTVEDVVKDKLVNGTCVSAPLYSQARCMIRCKETECKCSHPLRLRDDFETNVPPPCSVLRMNCLGNFVRASNSCDCRPACQRITAKMSMEETKINGKIKSYDPIYENVKSNSSIILNIRRRLSGTKSFALRPTETWFTLLSSLGGVFNMFLGIGLFSVLECLFFLYKISKSFCLKAHTR